MSEAPHFQTEPPTGDFCLLQGGRGDGLCSREDCRKPLTGKQTVWCSTACYWKVWDRLHPRIDPRNPPALPTRQRALPGESRVERAFAEWIASEDGAAVEGEVIRRARLLLSRGIRRYGIAGLWEAIRWDNTLALYGEAGAWKMNNSFRSLLARRIMAGCADLTGFFETRDLRGRA